jgi:hypothetical protein
MSRRRILLGLAFLGVMAGTAAPALAEDGTSRVCIMATNDRNHPGQSPLCVWLPIDKDGS